MERALRTLPLEAIACESQVRTSFGDEGIAGLAASLVSVGLQQPILVRVAGERFVVIDGERRYRAAVQAGWTTIQVLVEEGPTADPDRIVRQLVANCQREDLTPIETACAIENLISTASCTAGEAASRLGMSPARVSKLLSLRSLPTEVQDQVHAGTIKASTAYEIAKTRDETERSALVADATMGNLKRDIAARRSRGKGVSGKRGTQSTRNRKRGRRQRSTVALTPGCSLVVTGQALAVAPLLGRLEVACELLRGVASTELAAAELAELFVRADTALKGVADQHQSTPAERREP